ncbi:hypothetical protein TrLO_g10236 [Triparma laevis f. longispina]|uniref:CHK kinase-like domain-containing protein n=1 Tax=Triparma laevis f. longispina TaxID=1714387 RepID=A0A9W6ZEI6_9STRA|nr:hypothetical protein TrLO_g10236 [Triparma laevis f. longispina]
MRARTVATTLQKVCKLACCGFCPIYPRGENYGTTFPGTPKQLAKKGKTWVEAALRASGSLPEDISLLTLEITELGSIGLLGDIRVLTVTYDKPTDLPTKFIAKFAAVDFDARMITDLFDLTLSEVRFYTQLQQHLDIIDTPRCYYADIERLSNKYILLIEHLGFTRSASFRDFTVPNSLSVEEARLCMLQMARLHARYWGEKGKEVPWLNRTDNKLMEDLIPAQEKIMWRHFVKKDQGGTKPIDWNYVVPEKLIEKWSSVKKNTFLYLSRLEKHPFRTCLHGDTRLDNWFFYNDKSSNPAAGLIDWQLITVGISVQDLTWFFLGSVDNDFAREHEEGLLRIYLDELNKNLEKPIDEDAFFEEYSLAYFHSTVKAMVAVSKVKKSQKRNLKICDKMMCGALAGMERRDTWAAFEKLENNGLWINHKSAISKEILDRRKTIAGFAARVTPEELAGGVKN